MTPYKYVHAPHARPVEGAASQRPARWQQRPEQSNWGDFGPDDQLGRLNLITPEKVRQGAAEVKEGLRFCLSLPLDFPGGNALNPRRHPPVIKPTPRALGLGMNFALARENADLTDVVCDDYVHMFLQYSTQWDALAHVGGHFDADGDGVNEMVYYNGFRAGVDVQGPDDDPALDGQSRALALGIEKIAEHGVQGRAVMVDLRAHLGDGHTRVGYRQLAQIMRDDGVTVEPGDILCLHTGFAQLLLERNRQPEPDMAERFGAALDGRDRELHQWIIDSGIAAIVADNYGVEAIPARPQAGPCAFLPLHELCLFKLGMPFGELWYLTPLAQWLRASGRNRFLLTAPPLRLPGAVGSPVTPVGTV
ncbi:cyclase family protein [Cupriavidus taiwanensis]|uniref:cyclase family protein n=1 Tax=Cupriavidus taiwanensis TaxID=164546 RepID=UPI000E105CF6|nr:cyclase family protein [Cupriavidus taiwanensis]SOY70410.1 Cyclase family protein [Cupriavidus taiwanensis]SOY72088.1 Cyclase family protein [Cupriavidus taiwanensis]SOY95652.1 Cyclase family protein [Cupriavidus taiwanensis]SOZ74771.1 Cyclase family protein [Cupriavidus taiwanensis]SOZ88398.1 Cyclase family protein [Cupriavidus taiwanensis]